MVYRQYRFLGLCLPIAITIYTIVQTNNDNSIAEENRHQDIDLANKTRLNDVFIADNREKDKILNNYLKFLTNFFKKDKLNLSIGSSSRFVLQLNTLTVFSQLDSTRKSYLIRLLYQNDLITHRLDDSPLINLNSINLFKLNLSTHDSIQSVTSMFTCVVIAETDLTESSFQNVVLSGTYFQRSIMTNVDLQSTIAYNNFCQQANIQTSFNRSYLYKSSFIKSDYSGVTFVRALMNNSLLRQFQCIQCDFTYSSMIKCDFSYAKFHLNPRTVNLPSENLSTLFIETDLRESIFYETLFEKTIFRQSNLIEININQSYFIQCDLSYVIMNNCIITQTQFNHSKFISSNLNNCQINKVKMINVDFSQSNLINVYFTNSECYSCIFNRANLTGIHFQNTVLDHSYFINAIVNQEQLIKAKSIIGIHL